MVEFLKAPAPVVAFRITEVLDSEDYEDIFDALEMKLIKHSRVPVYADLVGFDHTTAQAIAKRVAYSIAKIGEWHRFPRIALITEREWISAMTRICTALIPRVEMKTFDANEREQAMRWVQGLDSFQSLIAH